MLPGVPLPHAPHLFCLFLSGAETEWAKFFPTRVLLRLGRAYAGEVPYPLWSDRLRSPLLLARDLRPQRPLVRVAIDAQF